MSSFSFDLVNHQIKHIFGTIEFEKNSSVQFLEKQHKGIIASLDKNQQAHKKISQALQTIKSSLFELQDSYFKLTKQTKTQNSLLNKIVNEINHLLQDQLEESLFLSKKIDQKKALFVPNIMKALEKYNQSGEKLEHYKKKVDLLEKTLQRNHSNLPNAEDIERYQRNKQKLKNAEIQYDTVLVKCTKKLIQFNHEGINDIYFDLIKVNSTFASNIMQSNRNFVLNISKNQAFNDLCHRKFNLEKKADSKQKMYQKLIQSKKIGACLLEAIQNQYNKVIQIIKIEEIFRKEGKSEFNFFKNIYTQDRESKMEIESSSRNDSEHNKKERLKAELEKEDRIKNNLDLFNRICLNTHKVRSSQKTHPNPNIAERNVLKLREKSPPLIINSHTNPTHKEQADPFEKLDIFSLHSPQRAQEALAKLHQHPIDLTPFHPQSNQSLTHDGFSNFDLLIFGKSSNKQEAQESTKTNSKEKEKTSQIFDDLLNL